MNANPPPVVDAAMLSVLLERQQQVARFGHDAGQDDALPASHLLRAAYVRLIDSTDLVMGHPDDATLLRVRRKTVQAAALCLAQIDRIDRQLKARANAISTNQGDPA